MSTARNDVMVRILAYRGNGVIKYLPPDERSVYKKVKNTFWAKHYIYVLETDAREIYVVRGYGEWHLYDNIETAMMAVRMGAHDE